MQVVIKPYDMLTLDAHSHNHITITICLPRFQDNLHDMLMPQSFVTTPPPHPRDTAGMFKNITGI